MATKVPCDIHPHLPRFHSIVIKLQFIYPSLGYNYLIPEQVIHGLSPRQCRVIIHISIMVYQADQNYNVPDVDVLSLLFGAFMELRLLPRSQTN